MSIHRSAELLLAGGIIAYPTEGVFGLGCLPDDVEAVSRLLKIKRRSPSKGLILIAARADQFDTWISPEDLSVLPKPDPEKPITWIATPTSRVLPEVRGEHPGLAVRITTHPIAAAICEAVDSPIVSTSANRSGQPVVRNAINLRRHFGRSVDTIVPGHCGPAGGASEIRKLRSGEVLRPGAA